MLSSEDSESFEDDDDMFEDLYHIGNKTLQNVKDKIIEIFQSY